ncbi:hypothetical protein Tco_0960359, partial [Tanacetum coccineum]
NVETIENVIEDESHFGMKVVDNNLGALAMFAKHFMGEHRKRIHLIDSNDGRGGGGLVVLGGRSSRESKSARGEVGGVKKISSTGSKLMVRGEECLEGCVGAGRDDFGVSKSLFSDIPEVVIGESGRELEIIEEPFSNRLEVIELGMKVMMEKGC